MRIDDTFNVHQLDLHGDVFLRALVRATSTLSAGRSLPFGSMGFPLPLVVMFANLQSTMV
jgi:hypothetical protein